jgi:hypothetical protein
MAAKGVKAAEGRRNAATSSEDTLISNRSRPVVGAAFSLTLVAPQKAAHGRTASTDPESHREDAAGEFVDAAVTRQIVLPTSSAIKIPPLRSIATPTGRPRV